MTTASRGISDHLFLESLERAAKHWASLGLTPQEAERAAIVFTLSASGDYTRQEAFEAADAILGTQRTPVDVTSTDQTLIH